MSTLRQQVAEPQGQSIPPHIRFPRNYNRCPSCNAYKTKQAKKCTLCTDWSHPQPRHAIRQPRDGSIKLVPLTRNKNALVDARHYEQVMQKRWIAFKATNGIYAITYTKSSEGKRISLPLPNFILNLPIGIEVDHRNGNSLDNRVENLRQATHQQNMRNRKRARNNTSGFIGVFFVKKTQLWLGVVKVNGRPFITKQSADKIEVAKARDQLAVLHHGEFASLNFPVH